jgi:hypothetical protein
MRNLIEQKNPDEVLQIMLTKIVCTLYNFPSGFPSFSLLPN